jgi:hypothetical protein
VHQNAIPLAVFGTTAVIELESLEQREESELESLEGPEGDDLPLWLDFPEREHPFFPTL